MVNCAVGCNSTEQTVSLHRTGLKTVRDTSCQREAGFKPSISGWMYLLCGSRGIRYRPRDLCRATEKAAAAPWLEEKKSLQSSQEKKTPELCCYEAH